MTPAALTLVTATVVVAAFIKGAVGFGFPLLATPLLALFLDVPLVISLLIVPNILMDGLQAVRAPGLAAAWMRHRWLIVSGTGGMFAGTAVLTRLPAAGLESILGIVVLAFVVLNLRQVAWRVAPDREWWLSPAIGMIGGVTGGVTNTPGLPLVVYFYALGLQKAQFVQSIALSFLSYKVAQLGAITYFGLLSWPVFGWSVAIAVVAVVAFRAGLIVQDRLHGALFNRVVLWFLGTLGLWLIVRSVGGE